MTNEEKRHFVRIDIEENAAFDIQIQNTRGEHITVNVKDISLSGIKVDFKSDFITQGGSTGDGITIIFTKKSADKPFLTLTGIIRWKKLLPMERVMFGIEFLGTTKDDKDHILKLIDMML